MADIEEVPESSTATVPQNSFQHLMEGKVEVFAKNDENGCVVNISELIRDLYKKLYALETLVVKK